MNETHFTQLPRGAVEDGSWFAATEDAWRAGRIGLLTLTPEASGDAELRAAIETMIESNETYRSGDYAVIHARPAALAMGCETAHLLQERGITTTVVFGMTTLAREVHALLDAVYGGPGVDFSAADPARLQGVASCYEALLDPIRQTGRGHWIVPVGTSADPAADDVPALDLFSKVASRALAPIGELRSDGRIVSHDIWLNPGPLDVTRLNEELPSSRHWTLPEWRSLIFRSMAVSAGELRSLAEEIEGVALTTRASLKGGRLRYQRGDGTDFTYQVTGRPVILDCGRVGQNAIGGTTAFRSAITNQPTTEVFVAPLEDSLSGVIVYTIPERTIHGVIRAPYRIEIDGGRVTDVVAPDEESRRILRNYTGLEPYDGVPRQGDEATAFELRRVIAEMAIAGFNPVMQPEIENGRLRPVTGLVLTDEKLGDHQAFGANDQFMGTTPSAHSDHNVEHTDFVGGIARTMTLVD
jgi:leucyl aminopeptidase (aminopeptidase T)